MQIDKYADILKAIDRLSEPTATLKTLVSVANDYGRQDRIERRLRDWASSIAGDFNDEHWHIVERAFARFGATPPSHNVVERCTRLVELSRKD